MPTPLPLVVVIGGPNGAGKTTTAPRLLQQALEVSEFVNADAIPLGLSAFRPESAGLAAGRAMLGRLKVLAEGRADFAWHLCSGPGYLADARQLGSVWAAAGCRSARWGRR